MKKDTAALDWLISKGADLGQQDLDGRSPICHAVYHEDIEMADLQGRGPRPAGPRRAQPHLSRCVP